MKYLLLLLCSMSLQADWDDWDESNKQLFKDYIVLNLVDAHQTYSLTNQFDPVIEKNPIYGRKPSAERIILVKGLTTYLFYNALDDNNFSERDKQLSLKIVNTVYLGLILHNGYIGLNLRKQLN